MSKRRVHSCIFRRSLPIHFFFLCRFIMNFKMDEFKNLTHSTQAPLECKRLETRVCTKKCNNVLYAPSIANGLERQRSSTLFHFMSAVVVLCKGRNPRQNILSGEKKRLQSRFFRTLTKKTTSKKWPVLVVW